MTEVVNTETLIIWRLSFAFFSPQRSLRKTQSWGASRRTQCSFHCREQASGIDWSCGPEGRVRRPPGTSGGHLALRMCLASSFVLFDYGIASFCTKFLLFFFCLLLETPQCLFILIDRSSGPFKICSFLFIGFLTDLRLILSSSCSKLLLNLLEKFSFSIISLFSPWIPLSLSFYLSISIFWTGLMSITCVASSQRLLTFIYWNLGPRVCSSSILFCNIYSLLCLITKISVPLSLRSVNDLTKIFLNVWLPKGREGSTVSLNSLWQESHFSQVLKW